MKTVKKLRAILKSKRGFTLIEVMLGITVSTILMLGISFVFSTIYSSYVSGIELSYNRVMATNIAEAIKDQLIASRIESVSSAGITYVTEFGKKTITSPNPHIEGLTYDSNYYMGKTVNLSFAENTVDHTYTITVSVSSNVGPNRTPYVLTRNIRLLNTP